MSKFEKISGSGNAAAAPASFGTAFTRSPQFENIFREGMELVERTAAYLDGKGRHDSRNLPQPVSISYATESMRLTTRLLEVASWLLVQRALKQGEITLEEAHARREKVRLRPSGRPSHIKHFNELPADLQDLIIESFTIGDRVLRIDQAMRAGAATNTVTTNPVGAQHSTLRAAFNVIQGGRS